MKKFKPEITKPAILIMLYIFLQELQTNIPYLNILTNNLDIRLLIILAAYIILYRPSIETTIFLNIVLMVSYGVLIIFLGQSAFDIFGLAIYCLLAYLAFRSFRTLKSSNG